MNLRGLIRWFLLITMLAGVLALAACGDDDEEGNGGASPTEAGGATEIDISAVPELEDGVLNVGSDIAYAPIEFYPEGSETPDGFDVDLGNAMAAELGRRGRVPEHWFRRPHPRLRYRGLRHHHVRDDNYR